MSDLNLFQDVDECVEDALRTVGNEVIVGLPIAVGKPTHIANALYRKAQQNSNIRLTLCSGLTLQTPKWKSDLERRFFEPLVGRLFPDYPDPAYLVDAHRKALPPNVMLKEFYFSPGLSLHNCHLQANYISTNYTHVARDISAMGANMTAVMMGKGSGRNEGMYNLGSNADATIMSIWSLLAEKKKGRKVAILGQVNENMPYMYGRTEVPPEYFTGILDNPKYNHQLFAPPKEPL